MNMELEKWHWDDVMNMPLSQDFLCWKQSPTTYNLVWHAKMLKNIENIKLMVLFPFGLEMNMTKILIILVKEKDE